MRFLIQATAFILVVSALKECALIPYYYGYEEERYADEEPTWNPTPAQFARYQAREVEMARENVRGMLKPYVTLHSDATIALAEVSR